MYCIMSTEVSFNQAPESLLILHVIDVMLCGQILPVAQKRLIIIQSDLIPWLLWDVDVNFELWLKPHSVSHIECIEQWEVVQGLKIYVKICETHGLLFSSMHPLWLACHVFAEERMKQSVGGIDFH